MSLSSALSNALTGLTMNARAAEVVSTNVANANTEGYARRELQLSPRAVGGTAAGVQVDGVLRDVDPILLRDRRLSDAEAGSARLTEQFYRDLETLVGVPDDPGSLSGRTASLEAALIAAASRPDLDSRLQAVAQQADGLAGILERASDGVQQLRMDAEADIARQVRQLNDDLEAVADLNALILRSRGSGRDIGGLLDQRQTLIDGISEIVPLRELDRANGTVALYTATGGLLLDTRPAEIGFARATTITADLSLGAGTLSGLTVNGVAIDTAARLSPIAGGTLSALFEIRDVRAPAAQSRLDSVARDLIERFADPAVDATLTPGDPGLFTDAGLNFDPLNETGLAARIAVNPAVDPASPGGALWRLRDGLGATAPGDPGNGAQLTALAEALRAPRQPASGDITSIARSANALAGDLVSLIGADLRAAEVAAGFATARQDNLRSLEFARGVDTDAELQRLLLIERNYAANAQVIRTADELIQQLLGI